jgi:hypothetical protein
MMSENIDKKNNPQNKNDRARWLILQRRLAEHRITEIFKILREHNIEPVLIKGWAAGLKYSQPWERFFSDIDIAVNPSDYQRAQEIAFENNLSVDLHKGLRHHDTLAWSDLYENSRLVLIDDAQIRILREEDHLRVLCVHWLTDGGAFKEKLLDIYYAVKNRTPDFDWKRCLESVSPHRRAWIVSTIGLAHRYCELEIDDLPFAEEARRLPLWLTDALEKEWRSGVRLLPINDCLRDRKMLWQQILKRIPPNPIEAMVEMEGDIDGRRRLFYQFGSIGKRLLPSVRRIFATLKGFS